MVRPSLPRCLVLTLALLATSAALVGTADAGVDRWTSLGPEGGHVAEVVASPRGDVLFALAAVESRLFRSDDGGKSWQRVYPADDEPLSGALSAPRTVIEPPYRRLALSTADPRYVLMLTWFGELLRSGDGGESWSLALDGHFQRLRYHPADDAFYAWGRQSHDGKTGPFRRYRSSDGLSWEASGQPADDVFRPTPHPRAEGILYDVDYVDGQRVMAFSDDGGVTWSPRAALPTNFSGDCQLAVDPTDGDELYVVCVGRRGVPVVARSEDGGRSLQVTASSGLPAKHGSAIRVVDDTLFLATSNYGYRYPLFGTTATGAGVFRSDDGGESWKPVGSEFGSATVSSLSSADDGTLWAATAEWGVLALPPGEPELRPANGGLTAHFLTALTIDPASGDLVAGDVRGRVLRRASGGIWEPMGDRLDPRAVTDLERTPSGYLATVGRGLHRWPDGASAWELVDEAANYGLAGDPFRPGHFYAFGRKSLSLWSADDIRPLTLPGDGNTTWMEDVAPSPNRRDLVFAANGGIWASEDGGESWRLDSASTYASYLAVPAGPAESALAAHYGGSLFSRHEPDWSVVPLDQLGHCFFRSLVADQRVPGLAYAGACSGRVVRTADGGESWQAIDSGGLPWDVEIRRVLPDPVDPRRLYLATDQGVYRRHLASAPALSLGQGRFLVRVAWRTPQGRVGVGTPRPLTADTGAFWFFRPDNVELVVKVLDGRAVNGRWWVFFASLSNVEYEVTVTDTLTGEAATYVNPQGAFASRGDTAALPPASTEAATAKTAAPTGVAPTSAPVPATAPDALLLADGRFRVEVDWVDFEGESGRGVPEPLTSDTGTFWFFNPDNVELVVKVLDGRPVNGHWWVFAGALTNVAYRLTVTDTTTGETRTWDNPAGTFASFGDTTAFAAVP